jgi:hypothetical protein
VSRWLRRAAAALLVACAALFIAGVAVEGDTHPLTTEGAAAHDEAAEAVNGEAGRDKSAESSSGEASHDESAEVGRILGLDVESSGAVVLAVAVSIVLAVGLWIRNQRWLAVAAATAGVVFAVFDVAEIVHQLDESRAGLVVLAAVIAAGHLAAAATAGLSTRRAARLR